MGGKGYRVGEKVKRKTIRQGRKETKKWRSRKRVRIDDIEMRRNEAEEKVEKEDEKIKKKSRRNRGKRRQVTGCEETRKIMHLSNSIFLHI